MQKIVKKKILNIFNLKKIRLSEVPVDEIFLSFDDFMDELLLCKKTSDTACAQKIKYSVVIRSDGSIVDMEMKNFVYVFKKSER